MPINLSYTGTVFKENKTSKEGAGESKSLMLEYKDKTWHPVSRVSVFLLGDKSL